MKSNEVFYSKGKNDECYTPLNGVLPILDYIPKSAIVWCPFDKKNSEFVKQISKNNKVVFSHIDENKDFFNYEPNEWDIIVSNPPFTNKRKYFERALSFNKPFALIMSITWLNDSAPKIIFKDKKLQLLMFDKRMRFINKDGLQMGSPTFSSAYFCHNFLPEQIIMKNLYSHKDKSLLQYSKGDNSE